MAIICEQMRKIDPEIVNALDDKFDTIQKLTYNK